MKTVKQWLETIADEEIREKALRNARHTLTIDFECEDMETALNSFTWEYTEEGYCYWSNINDANDRNELKTLIP